MQSFWHPFEPLLLALGHGAARTYSFFLILAQHRLFFLLLIGSSSKDIRRTSVGGETFIFFLICHETQICVTNSLNRPLCPKIWALYYSAEYCPRMRKRTFGWRESGLKRLCSSSLLKCWIMSSSRTLCLSTCPSHLISQTCVKGKALEFVVCRSRASSFPLGFLHLQVVIFIAFFRILTLKDMIKCASTCHVIYSAESL